MVIRWKQRADLKWTLWHRVPTGGIKTVCGKRFNPHSPPELIDVQWSPKGINQTMCKRCETG